MGKEEQVEEREVLSSIFPDEITDLTESSYNVLIELDLSAVDQQVLRPDDEDGDPISVQLSVSYPDCYPEVAPDLSVSFPASGRPSRLDASLLSFPDDAAQLLAQLSEPIEDTLGTAMVFTLISALKENIESLVQSRANTIVEAHDAEQRKAEEAENAKFAGEKVTRERFLAWRENFRTEMAELAEQEAEKKRLEDAAGGRRGKGAQAGEDAKPTGRQLWERGLVSKEDEDDGAPDDAAAQLEKTRIES